MVDKSRSTLVAVGDMFLPYSKESSIVSEKTDKSEISNKENKE